jgi:hypothetical protein
MMLQPNSVRATLLKSSIFMTLLVNELYLTVIPLIHLNNGATEQVVTLTPDRTFATEFFPDEVDTYIRFFESRSQYLVGGHVKGYTLTKENTVKGLYVVRVTQMG